MKSLEETYRRPIGEELSYVCDRLKADEVEILGKALRRGLLEIYKASSCTSSRPDASTARRRRTVSAAGSWSAPCRSGRPRLAGRPQRPGPRKIPRRRNR